MKEKIYKKLSHTYILNNKLNLQPGESYYILDKKEDKCPVYDKSGYVVTYINSNYISENDVLSRNFYFVERNGTYLFEPIKDNSGGKVSYYTVTVNPINGGEIFKVEFEDIALALGLTPMEYNIMKDLWRNANARTNGNGKKGNTQLRTYQKVAHYGNLLLKLEERK